MIETDPFRSHHFWAWVGVSLADKSAVFLALCLPFLRNPVKLLLEQKPWNMNSIAKHALAIEIGVATLSNPQISLANGLTGEQFETWQAASQDNYIQSSVMMAGAIAAQIQPELSRCVDDWYFQNDATKTARNAEIRALIAQYATYHPSGVILAAVQQECGAFN